jgi:hypothetical protein
MRAKIAALLVVALAANTASSQPTKPKEQLPAPVPRLIKTDFAYFEYLGLRHKSFSLDFFPQKTPNKGTILIGRITYLLEFDKNVTNYDLDNLRATLAPQNLRLRHIFFDDDNVAINAYRVYEHRVFGEVSGVKGEAFRILVEFVVEPDVPVQRGTKLVVRRD